MRFFRCRLSLYFLVVYSTLQAQQGVAYHKNLHAYWYFLTPTGFGPPPKKTIFQNGDLAAFQYQKTTFRGNTTTFGLIPTLLIGEDFMPVWVSGHLRFPLGSSPRRPKTVVNLGGFFLSLPQGSEGNNFQDFSLFYGNITFGSREKNLAVGTGIAPTGFGQGIHPQAFTLHGLTRLGRRSCLISENYILYDRGDWIPCTLSGWRKWNRQTAFDVALLLARVPAGSSLGARATWLPIPWLAVHHTLRFDPLMR